MKSIQIAIDGPASSGKSTVAKQIAAQLGYTYLDTGAMYRCATLLALRHHWDDDSVEALLAELDRQPIRFERSADGSQLVFLGTEDVSLAIRDNDVTNHVSRIAAIPAVRQKLVEQQQHIASQGGIVMDGRDIGTVVLPQAELKIYLIASVEERAQRRYKENKEKGILTDLETLKEEIATRDHKDSSRQTSPLKPADDALILDTTGISISDVVAWILKKAEEILDKTSKS